MDHLGIEPVVRDKSVAQLCEEKGISQRVFILLANLYNGFHPNGEENFSAGDLSSILLFLQSSHQYYRQEKYPEIRSLIGQLYNLNAEPGIRLVEPFFDEYFAEVTEHLDYEDTVVFPYFSRLRDIPKPFEASGSFSATEYQHHHTDIELKLADLKNLLLMHIPAGNDRQIRRKLLISLYDLEFDLRIHSMIEDTVLIPLIGKIEAGINHV
jgi:regulator of cell morphogenesis and NO signaling